jgi:hypothetical protein
VADPPLCERERNPGSVRDVRRTSRPPAGWAGRPPCWDSRLRAAAGGDLRPILVRDLCGMPEKPAVELREKMPICRDFSGSDGTRTCVLRRDRPVLVVAGWARSAGIPAASGAFRPACCGDSWVLVGTFGSLVRDQRWMRRCRDGDEPSVRVPAALSAAVASEKRFRWWGSLRGRRRGAPSRRRRRHARRSYGRWRGSRRPGG